MSPRVLVRVAVVFASSWLPCLIPASAGAVGWGLADQYDGPFRDSRIAAANVTLARLIVPWDVAYQSAPQVDLWMDATGALGTQQLVAFERSRGDACPEAACTLPSVEAFRDAFDAFRRRWPSVHEFEPWNEPNHSWQPTASDPERAAAFHDALRDACASCTIVAGSFVDSASMKTYFSAYLAALQRPVQVWGLHNYGDLTYDRPSYADWLLDRTTEPLWLTETGGIVFLRSTATGMVTLPYDEQRGVRAMTRLLQLVATHPDRLERAYVYQWQVREGESFDAGLLAPDGRPRPALGQWLAAVGPRPVPVGGPPPLATAPAAVAPNSSTQKPQIADAARVELAAAGLSPAAALPGTGRASNVPVAPFVDTAAAGTGPRIGSARRTRHGWSVAVRCPAAKRGGCRGSLRLVAKSGDTSRVVGRRTLRLHSARWTRVRVPRTRAVAKDAELLAIIRVRRPVRVGVRHLTIDRGR